MDSVTMARTRQALENDRLEKEVRMLREQLSGLDRLEEVGGLEEVAAPIKKTQRQKPPVPPPRRRLRNESSSSLTKEPQETRRASVQKKPLMRRPAAVDVEEKEGSDVRGSSARPWSETMKLRSFEVEYLLRSPPTSDAEIDATLASVRAGLSFLEELDVKAGRLGVLRGTLSRWILPYDQETAAASQQSREASVLANAPDYFVKGDVTEDECRSLIRGANGLRDLIRVKLADNGDLDQAKAGLELMLLFYQRLGQEAKAMKKNGSAFALLKRCR